MPAQISEAVLFGPPLIFPLHESIWLFSSQQSNHSSFKHQLNPWLSPESRPSKESGKKAW